MTKGILIISRADAFDAQAVDGRPPKAPSGLKTFAIVIAKPFRILAGFLPDSPGGSWPPGHRSENWRNLSRRKGACIRLFLTGSGIDDPKVGDWKVAAGRPSGRRPCPEPLMAGFSAAWESAGHASWFFIYSCLVSSSWPKVVSVPLAAGSWWLGVAALPAGWCRHDTGWFIADEFCDNGLRLPSLTGYYFAPHVLPALPDWV